MTAETPDSTLNKQKSDGDKFIGDAAGRVLINGQSIWKFQRGAERDAKTQAAEAHVQKQAAARAKREELLPLLGTFKERMAPPKALDPIEVARAETNEMRDETLQAVRERLTPKERWGSGLAKIEEHDDGLSKVADMPSRLQDNLDANRQEKADRARGEAEKAAKLQAQTAVSKEAWKTGPKSEPKAPHNQIEWSGGGPISDAVKAGRRSKEDILNDPMPWTVSIKRDIK